MSAFAVAAVVWVLWAFVAGAIVWAARRVHRLARQLAARRRSKRRGGLLPRMTFEQIIEQGWPERAREVDRG